MIAKTLAEYQAEGRSPEILFWVGSATTSVSGMRVPSWATTSAALATLPVVPAMSFCFR